MSPAGLAVFLALRQLRERKLLNGIAVAGVTLGVVMLVVMSNVMNDFTLRFESEVQRVSPHITLYARLPAARPRVARDYAPAVAVVQVAHEQPATRATRIRRPRELVRQLAAMPGVEAVCMGVVGQAVALSGALQLAAELHGVVPEVQDRCTRLAGYVDHGSWAALAASADGAVIGTRLAQELGLSVGDRLSLVSEGGVAVPITLVGILHTRVWPVDTAFVYVHLSVAQTVLGRADTIDRMEVRLHDGATARAAAATIERVTGYDTESWQEATANYYELLNLQTLIVRMMIGAILTVSGFGILAVQIMMVLQKTRDISILRSIGFRRSDVLLAFLVQGVIVASLGALLGDVVAWRLVEWLAVLRVSSGGMIEGDTFLVVRTPLYYALGPAFALVVGTAASMLPAWRASRIEPVDVLRGLIG